jgi:hypothetical protein
VVADGIALDQGPAARNQQISGLSLHFSMTATKRADLLQLLAAQQDRRSPQYHKFLTPEEYAERFGLEAVDIEKVSRWLENSGFHHLQVARSRTWIGFSGTVAQAETAFHTSIRRYSVSGEVHFANATDARLPKALEGTVEGVRGLNDMRLKPAIRRLNPQFTSSISGSHFLAPEDWATIYDVKPLYGAGLDGTGVTIAIVGQSDVHLAPIQAFRTAAGLSANAPMMVIPPGDPDPGFVGGEDELESYLDLEWASGIAKNANILFIASGHGVESSMRYAIDNNVAPIVSESYGLCEPQETTSDFNTQTTLFQQANAQGITIVASSGDSGAAACDQGVTENAATLGLAVNFPASSPYVTGVGGTDFNEGGGNYWNTTNNSSNGSALSYIPEVVWNDAFQSASGGGASILVTTKPAWQTGLGVPADGVRDVPDIAFAASPNHDGYLICEDGGCTNGFRNSANNLDVIGGTSAGAPSFAGLLALVIQQNGAGTRLGNINPNLYSLAQISPNAFHDVTTGNNEQVCATSTPNCPTGGGQIGYVAGPGYDQTTGWGSVDGYNLAQQWYGDFQITASPTTLTIQPGASATSTVNLAAIANFNGNVSFACSVSSNLIGVTCSVPSTTLNSSGATTVTITAASNARLIRPPAGRSPLLLLPFLLLLMVIVALRQPSVLKLRPVLACASMCLIVIAFGASSCGGGGTSSVSTGGGTTPAPGALALSCNLPAATVGAAYSGSCTASGGTAPYSYSISSGTLPAGLSINSATGAITGTPTTATSAGFTVEVTDSSSPKLTLLQANNLAVSVAPPPKLTLSCVLPASASVGTPYSGSCAASGGTTPLTFSISQGSLPAGLTLTSSGALSGTPTMAGTTSFTVTVTDSGSPAQMASQTISSFVVAPSALSLNCLLAINNAQVGIQYNYSCTAVGGTAPFIYSISAGSLPPGLTLNTATGFVTGVPTLAGAYSFTVRVSDSGSPVQTAQSMNSFSILPAQPLSLACQIPNSQVGAVFQGGCGSYGGTMPYTFSLGGTPPPGLTISTAPNQSGIISGTATTAGTFAFSVKVTDSSSPPASLTQAISNYVVAPRASETGTVTITATSGSIVSTTTITVTVP